MELCRFVKLKKKKSAEFFIEILPLGGNAKKTWTFGFSAIYFTKTAPFRTDHLCFGAGLGKIQSMLSGKNGLTHIDQIPAGC